MCGIAGWISANPDARPSEADLRSMAGCLRHRGPDHQGLWLAGDRRVGLAHTRLAIQDLSPAGVQPMASRGGRYRITYNGEIYNFVALRRELERTGMVFTGGSDTEVLLAGIEAYGLPGMLERVEGMFAFALWDEREQILHLVRDRIGEKPLFFSVQEGSVAFASQVSALTRLSIVSRTIRHESVHAFLSFGYLPTPLSIYANVHKLVPGTYLSIALETLAGHRPVSADYDEVTARFGGRRYWDLRAIAREARREDEGGLEGQVERIGNVLESVVRDQMISDVPYGAFLSGGIDSSLVVALMQRVGSDPVKTFTIGFDNERFDEATHARGIAEHLGTEHHELYVSEDDLLAVVPRLDEIYDEPFADPSQIPTALICAMARRTVTVVLSGDGGDELFAGYNRYRMLDIWRWRRRLPAPAIRLLRGLLSIAGDGGDAAWARRFSRHIGPQSSGRLLLRKIERVLGSGDFAEAYRFMLTMQDDVDALLSEAARGRRADVLRPDGIEDEFEQMLLWDQLGYLTDDNMVKVDRASMAVSLETRHPLLNHRVVEASWRIPARHKMTPRDNKVVLKRLLTRLLPASLVDRPKMGFSVPLDEWLRGPLRGWAEDVLHSRSADLGYDGLDDRAILEQWRRFADHGRGGVLPVWRTIMLKSWLLGRRDRFL